MHNHIQHILAHWLPLRDNHEWVAGFVYQTQGPCYRKTGALMMFSDSSQQLGLLSGGCLEADLMRRARMVMQTQQPQRQRYDASDDNDLSFQLGIGCGGIVDIVLLPVSSQNNYLGLVELAHLLQQHNAAQYTLPLSAGHSATANAVTQTAGNAFIDDCLHLYYTPLPHLLVVGGGIDARPVAQLAIDLGWQLSVCDPRPANARAEHFPQAAHIIRDMASLPQICSAQSVSAAVIMSHSIELDATALQLLQPINLQYLALLGPAHRKQHVLDHADLNDTDFSSPLFGPAGLDLGGELPESIALSILAQCHQQLYLATQQ